MNYKEFKNSFEKKEVIEVENKVKTNPLVSICVQTYQHVDYISKCIEGILDQETDFYYEILLGEDDSKDGTREICLKLAKKHNDRIRLFLHSRENNISICGEDSGRFNFLYNIYNARGEYLAICEGDDQWLDTKKLQKQINFLKSNKNFSLHCTDAKVSDKSINNKLPKSGVFNACDILTNNFIYTASVCLRRNQIVIPSYIVQSPAADWLINLYALRDNKNGYFSNEISCLYRIHKGGVWSQLEKKTIKHINRKFKFIRANISIYEFLSIDNSFNKKTREIAFQKKDSYIYLLKKMILNFPHLKNNDEDLVLKSFFGHLKLLLIKIKNLL